MGDGPRNEAATRRAEQIVKTFYAIRKGDRVRVSSNGIVLNGTVVGKRVKGAVQFTGFFDHSDRSVAFGHNVLKINERGGGRLLRLLFPSSRHIPLEVIDSLDLQKPRYS